MSPELKSVLLGNDWIRPRLIRPVDGVSHSDLDLLGQEVPLRVEALRCFHQTLFSLKTWWNISWFKNQVKYSSTASCSETGSETGRETGSETGSGRCVPGSCLCVRPSPPPDPAGPSAACWQTAGRFHSPHWPVRSPRTPHTAPCHPMSAGTAAPEETHTRWIWIASAALCLATVWIRTLPGRPPAGGSSSPYSCGSERPSCPSALWVEVEPSIPLKASRTAASLLPVTSQRIKSLFIVNYSLDSSDCDDHF